MPPLPNPRHEAFAQSRATGASRYDAYEDAGFVHGHRHGARMAQRLDTAAGVAELRVERTKLDEPAIAAGTAIAPPAIKIGDVFEKVTLEQ